MENVIPINTSTFAEYDDAPLRLLRDRGLTPALNPHGRNLTREELVALCGSARGIIAGTEPLDACVLAQLPDLKVISRCGAGMSNVDLEEARRRGIRVLNTPDAPTMAVAELTLGLILSLLRQVSVMDAALKRGEWRKKMGNLLQRKKVGIIGYGRIGRQLELLLKPFECPVAYCDPQHPTGPGAMPLDELLPWADLVSLHASSGKRILGERELSAMKPGAWLVNVARGESVDEAALCDRLSSGALAGAALDVFAKEPYSGPLAQLSNVLLTPHVGSYARESRINMELEAAQNLLCALGEA